MANKPKLLIGDTNGYGHGIYTWDPISKGSIIYILKGKVMSLNKVVSNINRGAWVDDHLQIGRKVYMELNIFDRLFNHSCKPNAGLRKKCELFALRDIKEYEQITFDYSLTTAPTNWKMYCKCGEPNCRKVLGDVTSIPMDQLKDYIANGNIQDFMKPIVKEILSGKYKIPEYELKALNKLNRTDDCSERI